MGNIKKYTLAFIVVAACLIYLFVSSLSSGKIYYKEVSEVVSSGLSSDSWLRVSGKVGNDGIVIEPIEGYAEFFISDGVESFNVLYKGIIPDAFEAGADVVIEGKYNSVDKVFSANKLMAKCPSKYEALGDVHPEEINKIYKGD